MPSSLPLYLFLLLFTSTLPPPSTAAPTGETSFVFGGCSQSKYTPGSTIESNLNSLLTSLLNSASFALYTNFTVAGAGDGDTVYGLYQCRGDLENMACAKCVTHAVAQLGSLCLDASGGALQLEGCFVKYDNVSFLGVEDKTVVVKKCGAMMGYDSGGLARRDAVLAYLAAADGSGGYRPFRVGGSGDVQGVAQCVGDLDALECQDCVAAAVGRLRTDCAAAGWGDVFLGKCYARFSHGGVRPHGGGSSGNDGRNDDVEIEKTLAVIIGLIAGIAFIVVFLAFLSHYCDKRKGGGK